MHKVSLCTKSTVFEQRKKKGISKTFEGKGMINILPQPRQMFEFAARQI